MKHHRLARVAEAIREAASEAILFQIKDPRVKFTTVTRAEVSGDLQHAKVYVSVMGSDRDRALTLHGLRSAAGFIQNKVGDRMKSRYVPILEFVLDEGVRNSLEVARLLGEEKARSQESEVSSEESEVSPSDSQPLTSDS
ncbi:MAG TPA: 30S ribosome-binding factor RbfA [Gemmataceae bacterium]|jgi:ribosome-binding factor A|nr:30S ribosome-binding factor RbfA [Gemmataceae bacterium]